MAQLFSSSLSEDMCWFQEGGLPILDALQDCCSKIFHESARTMINIEYFNQFLSDCVVWLEPHPRHEGKLLYEEIIEITQREMNTKYSDLTRAVRSLFIGLSHNAKIHSPR